MVCIWSPCLFQGVSPWWALAALLGIAIAGVIGWRLQQRHVTDLMEECPIAGARFPPALYLCFQRSHPLGVVVPLC